MRMIPLQERYLAPVKALCDQSVGEGFYSLEDWRRIMGQPGHFCNLLLEEDGTLIGYNYNHLAGEDEAAGELKLPTEELRQVAGAPRGAIYGICKSMGILPPLRKSGLGFGLLRSGVDQLYQNGACSLWGSAWKQGNRIPMKGIFGQLNFSYLHDVERVWYEIEGLRCPACKQPRCVCQAALFYQNREVWESERAASSLSNAVL